MTRKAGTVEEVAIADLVLDPSNARRHGERNLETIKASLRRFGQQHPLVVGLDGVVVAGNGRLEAMRAEGWTHALVRWTDLEGADRAAFAIADNRTAELAEWSDDELVRTLQALDDDLREAAGFDDDEVAEIMRKADADDESNTDDDDAPTEDQAAELAAKWGTETGQIWEIGPHRLAIGDACDADLVRTLMAGDQADAVFTSPPYAVGVDYGDTYDDTLESLRGMLPRLADLWREVVRPGGYAVVNFGDLVKGRAIAGTDEPCEYPMALEYYPVFLAAGWVLWSRRVWVKPGAGTGSLQCVSSNRAATNWEHVWTFKAPGKALHHRQTTGQFPSQNGHIDTTREHKLEVGLKTHGAGMPVGTAMFGIATHALKGGIVLEPFTGTGTTMVAGHRLGRRVYGTEINPQFAALAIERAAGIGLAPDLAE